MGNEEVKSSRQIYEDASAEQKEALHSEAFAQAAIEDASHPSAVHEEMANATPRETSAAEEAVATSRSERAAEKPTVSENIRERIEHARASLSLGNRGFFNKMTEGGKKIMGEAYEKISDIPVVGKVQIAYNQFWADKHEEKAVDLKSRIDSFTIQAGALSQARQEITSVVDHLKLENLPGFESLQLKLKDIDQQQTKLLNEKDKVQSQFEARGNKVKLYSNERDRIADKFVSRYDERLAPMEKELGMLETTKDETDLLMAVTEAKHKDQLLKLGTIETRKTNIEQMLKKIGEPEENIKKTVAGLEMLLVQGREAIRMEKERLAKQKIEIDKKIAKADEKANPYRDKREEFVRAKEGRPLEMDVPKRGKSGSGSGFGGTETIATHTRAERPEEAPQEDETANNAVHEATEVETPEIEDGRITTTAFITEWNRNLKELAIADTPIIDAKDFLKVTKLATDFRMSPGDFKKISERYYTLKKLPKGTFSKTFDKIIKKMEADTEPA